MRYWFEVRNFLVDVIMIFWSFTKCSRNRVVDELANLQFMMYRNSDVKSGISRIIFFTSNPRTSCIN